jgi:hypothetical protein
MSEKPKRPWFRFHLLTAIVLVISSGGLIGLNTVLRFTEVSKPDIQEVRRVEYHGYGWPLVTYVKSDVLGTGIDGKWREGKPNVIPIAVLADGSATLALLVAITFLSEYLIRRREARKT